MNPKTLLSLMAIVSLVSQVALGAMGTESGGGGDADAVDVLTKIRAVAEWSKGNESAVSTEEAQRISSVAEVLSLKMDRASQTPIVMVSENLTDASGASKVALFDLNSFKIKVTRSKWKALSGDEKFVIAALELYGLAGVPERYVQAGLVKKEASQVQRLEAQIMSDDSWGAYGYTDFGIFQGVDTRNQQCRVIVDSDWHSTYTPGDLNRSVYVKFADVEFLLYFDKVIDGQGQMPRNALMYTVDSQGRKSYRVKDLNFQSPIFLGGKGNAGPHPTLKASASMDIKKALKLTIATAKGNLECRNLKKLSILQVVSMILAKVEPLFKKSLVERKQNPCTVICDQADQYWKAMENSFAKTKQQVAKGDGAGAVTNLINFKKFANTITEDTWNNPTPSLEQISSYFIYDDVPSILKHLQH